MAVSKGALCEVVLVVAVALEAASATRRRLCSHFEYTWNVQDFDSLVEAMKFECECTAWSVGWRFGIVMITAVVFHGQEEIGVRYG